MTDPGWVVTPKDAPAELAEGYPAPPFDATVVASEQPELTEPTSLRTDTDEWLRIMHRMSDSDRAAVEKVLGMALDVMP